MNFKHTAIAAFAVLAWASSASGAAYNFNVIYNGNDMASLAAGSDDPTAIALVAGDTFTYRLSAAGAGEWSTLANGSIFPFFSLNVAPGGTRIVDFVLNLNNDGSSVFNFSENNINNSFAHLGTNSVSFANGLIYDEYELAVTILSTTAATTANGLLPWPNQGPENYSPNFIAFNANAIPEPASWALMILGFGMAGAGLRASRVRASFA